MPIHDQGYRRYEGTRAAHGRGWWVIARHHIISPLRRRWFLALLLAAWVPFVINAVRFYLAATFQQLSALAATSETFREFLGIQSFFVFLVTIAHAGLVADDRRANALQVYLSKPLTRLEYVFGKLVPLLVFLLGVTFLPGIILLLVQMMFAGSTAFVRDNLFLFPAITLFSLIQALLAAFAILAFSSLSKSRRFVAIMYAGLSFFTAAMYQALRGITGSRAWATIAPGQMLDVLADAIFRVRSQPPVPVPVAMLVIVALIGVFIFILERRIRCVEIVT